MLKVAWNMKQATFVDSVSAEDELDADSNTSDTNTDTSDGQDGEDGGNEIEKERAMARLASVLGPMPTRAEPSQRANTRASTSTRPSTSEADFAMNLLPAMQAETFEQKLEFRRHRASTIHVDTHVDPTLSARHRMRSNSFALNSIHDPVQMQTPRPVTRRTSVFASLAKASTAVGGSTNAATDRRISMNSECQRSMSSESLCTREEIDVDGSRQKALGTSQEDTDTESAFSEERSQAICATSCPESWEDGSDAKPWIFTQQADAFFGGVIIVNSVYIGVETDYHASANVFVWAAIECFFLAIVLVELFLRFRHRNMLFADEESLESATVNFWRNPWNLLDVTILTAGVVDTIMLVMGVMEASDAVEVRDLILGMVDAIRTLTWALMLVVLTLFMCSIFTTKFLAANGVSCNDSEDCTSPQQEQVDLWFGTVPRSILTLFQLMTLDDWTDVTRLSMDANGTWTVVFFIAFVLFTNWGLLNMVTGIMVERVVTISCGEKEKEMQREEEELMNIVENVHMLFDTVLGDLHSGGITLQDFKTACKSPAVMRQLKNLKIPAYEAEQVFVLMDTARTGAIEIDRFIEGCLRIRGQPKGKHLLAVQYDVQKVWSKLSEQLDEMQDFISESFAASALANHGAAPSTEDEARPLPGVDRHSRISEGVGRTSGILGIARSSRRRPSFANASAMREAPISDDVDDALRSRVASVVSGKKLSRVAPQIPQTDEAVDDPVPFRVGGSLASITQRLTRVPKSPLSDFNAGSEVRARVGGSVELLQRLRRLSPNQWAGGSSRGGGSSSGGDSNRN